MNRITNNLKHTKKEKKIKKHPILCGIRNFLIFLILIIIILGILFYKKVEENGGGIQGVLCTLFGQSVDDLANLEPINILLLGISEDINTELTDTIILCSYNPQTQQASMISIPRDTFVGKNKNYAKGTDKINSLYTRGIDKTISAVENILDCSIDYYAVVKIHSLIKIIDIIGGINFEVPIDMDYDDPTQDLHIHLSQGMQKIDGEKAEQLLRFRHNNDGSSYPIEYGDNDFGRMKTQRNFITETIKQTLTIQNLPKAKEIINTIFENLDTNIEINDIIPYIIKATEFDFNNIISNQLPGESQKCNDLWFFIYDKKQIKNLIY